MIKNSICLFCKINFSFNTRNRSRRKYCTHECSVKNRTLTTEEKHKSLVKRFNKLVLKNKSGCWGWKGYIPKGKSGGYGCLNSNGKNEKAHRISWTIHNGIIPNKLWVLHHCDNRVCSNPKHLYLGTIKENSRDAKERNRFKNPNKTSDDIVRKIKQDLKEKKLRGYQIANKYNLCAVTISNIKTGKIGKHINL